MTTTPTPYVALEDGQKALPPPTYNSHSTKNKPPFCRCIFCFCIFLLFLILTLLLLAFYFYTVNHPQVPSYTVEDLEVKAFGSQPDFTFETQFLVTVKADNPNGNIGIIYGEDSSVNVLYDGTDVCSGKLPNFHQGPMNVTMMKVDLVGKSEFGSGLQEAYRKSSQIPLLVMVRAPVRIVVGEYTLREMKVFVNCLLVVDNLAPNKKLNIVSSNTTFEYEF
ncbi:hypothetical protein ACS0TY_031857 [Phlomoides rotata]